jgi:hypothetical protein
MESYLLINTQSNPQICDNIILWNGDVNIWTPPSDHIALQRDEVYCLEWNWNASSNTWILVENLGTGQMGYTWDGTKLTTNEPQPTEPPIVIDTQVDNF